MKIKRFFAADMRQAIRKVREEQGPDAVILSNRKVDGGVEIVSAVDYDEALINKALHESATNPPDQPRPATTTARPAARTEAEVPAAARPAPAASGSPRAGIQWAQDPALVAMKEEIRELRGLLEHQLAHLAWGDMNHNRPQQLEVLRRLHALGMKPAMALHLAERVSHGSDPEQAWRAALGLFAQSLPVTNDDILERGGMVALVGATGVGKTTTVAKLAARFALRHGQKRVALVTTDGYRIGAHEQLLTYGKILGVPVQVASDHDQLAQTLKSLMDKHLVLIDTAGMSQRDLRLTEQFSTLAHTGLPIRSYLVMSATAQPAVQEETVRAFRGVSLDGCILTKVDETASLGGALSVISEQQLPLAYVADGQRVPEDMQPARPHVLVNKAAEMLVTDWFPGDAVLAERFGGAMANAHV
ncbi:MAG: flagellar biosynthesis protein FlhF [Gammaproteobacteria bacterium]|nr:flagellar biosynthesis protein FlhF [Gammaproteobacteria bacterium]